MNEPLPVLPEAIEELDEMICRWRDAAKAVEGMPSGIAGMAKLYLHGLETARKIICNWSQSNPAPVVFDKESGFQTSKISNLNIAELVKLLETAYQQSKHSEECRWWSDRICNCWKSAALKLIEGSKGK